MSAASAALPGARNPLLMTSVGVAVPADLRNLMRFPIRLVRTGIRCNHRSFGIKDLPFNLVGCGVCGGVLGERAVVLLGTRTLSRRVAGSSPARSRLSQPL